VPLCSQCGVPVTGSFVLPPVQAQERVNGGPSGEYGLTKAEEYLLIAKLAADNVIEQRYEDPAQELRDRIAEAFGVRPAGDHHCEDQPRNAS
jgi:hypothetical protein